MVEDYPLIEKFKYKTPIKIASIGRFEYLKGSDTIKNTLFYLNQNKVMFDWTLFVPPVKNDEELLNELGNLVIVKKGLKNNQVLEEIEKMDVLFFPSRSEGFSMAVIECLKRGIVVIARDIPMGIPEIIENNINGLICKNDHEFITAILKFIEDSELLLTMKKNAAEIANKKFSYELECNNLLNLILNSKSNSSKTYEVVELIDPKLPEFILPLMLKNELFTLPEFTFPVVLMLPEFILPVMLKNEPFRLPESTLPVVLKLPEVTLPDTLKLVSVPVLVIFG